MARRWIVPSLALGLLTTILVAWSIALFSDPQMRLFNPLPPSSVARQWHASRGFGGARPGTVEVAVFDFPEPLSQRDASWYKSLDRLGTEVKARRSDWTDLLATRPDDTKFAVARVYGFPTPASRCDTGRRRPTPRVAP